MSEQTVTLNLPDDMYERLQETATASEQPVESVIIQAIQGNLPPTMQDIPIDLQQEIMKTMQRLDDHSLWEIANEALPLDQWERHQELLDKNQEDSLEEAEQEELMQLRIATDHALIRRSYALALLKWRGYTLPVYEQG